MKHQTISRDPVCGKKMNKTKAHIIIKFKGTDYLLCCPRCQSEFEKNPQMFITDN